MLTAIQEGDAIFSRAIEIPSAEERAAFIAKACGPDAVLRRQVEERVAAHFRSRNGSEKATSDVAASHPSRRHLEPAGMPQGHRRAETTPATTENHEGRKRPSSAVLGLGLVALSAVIGGVGLGAWAIHTQREASQAVQQAKEEREKAQKSEEQLKQEYEKAELDQHKLAADRDLAVAEVKAAKDAAEDMKAALAFFQGKVLSAGRHVGWTGVQSKDITLRQAVDAAEAQVAGQFADRPLAEAAVRELLGTTYLDMTEPALAVKQFERALALRERLQKHDHPDTVVCRNKLAVAYRLAGRPEDASRLYNEVTSPSS
jgi:hypothetical protein